MLHGPFTLTPQYMWLENDGPHDHLLSDLDGTSHFLLVKDQCALGYFDPCLLSI